MNFFRKRYLIADSGSLKTDLHKIIADRSRTVSLICQDTDSNKIEHLGAYSFFYFFDNKKQKQKQTKTKTKRANLKQGLFVFMLI